MYSLDEKELVKKPEIRIGYKVYRVDDRLSTFEKMNSALKNAESGEEFEIIVVHSLGKAAYQEIMELDISVAVMQKITTLILAAIQGISEADAEARFQTGGRGK